MSEFLNNTEYKKKLLKDIIRELHHGKSPEELKEKFKGVLKNVSPLEIPLIEQELVKEGLKASEIAKLCDLHVLIFREAVQNALKIDDIPDGHPLKTLALENEQITKDAEMLGLYSATLEKVKDRKDIENILNTVREIASKIKSIYYTHYDREEMVIFPHIEKRGISAVSQVLWRKHDEIRVMIKKLLNLLEKINPEDQKAIEELTGLARDLSTALVDMVFRENNILYPTLKTLLSEGEWVAIKLQEPQFGYYGIKVKDEWKPDASPIYPHELSGFKAEDMLSKIPQHMKDEFKKNNVELLPDNYEIKKDGDFEVNVGFLNPQLVDMIFKHLPVDVTYIDENDRVKFYSGGDRIFPRSPSIIGRPVQLCHPPKSVYIVNKILNAFKSGERDTAEFWIQMGPKFVYITYYAIRDEKGNYRGTLEVTQEVSRIRKLEGQKRLLDWN